MSSVPVHPTSSSQMGPIPLGKLPKSATAPVIITNMDYFTTTTTTTITTTTTTAAAAAVFLELTHINRSLCVYMYVCMYVCSSSELLIMIVSDIL